MGNITRPRGNAGLAACWLLVVLRWLLAVGSWNNNSNNSGPAYSEDAILPRSTRPNTTNIEQM